MLVRKFFFVVLGLTMYFCVSFAYNKMSLPFMSFMNTTDTEIANTEDDDKNTIQVALLLDTRAGQISIMEYTQ